MSAPVSVMRLFIALPIPTEIRHELAKLQAALPGDNLPLDWQPRPRMHLTLHFLGDYPDDTVERLTGLLEIVAGKHATFPLEITRLGAFPDESKPHVIWVGIAHNPLLVRLQADLGHALAAAGFRTEIRLYHPHITLARSLRELDSNERRQIRHLMNHPVRLNQHTWQADRITLYRSHHDEFGLHYSPLGEAKLIPHP